MRLRKIKPKFSNKSMRYWIGHQ